MKKILGLDLGVTSIGWALIEEDDAQNPASILGLGCRIIPYAATEDDDFTRGSGESKCSRRTMKRTMRKGMDRYQLRRTFLKKALEATGIMPGGELFTLGAQELYGLRVKALLQQVTLPELGRIFFHLNQKRGYKHARSDDQEDKKQTEYVASVNSRYDLIRRKGITVGCYFYEGLASNCHYRVKEQIFPRKAYEEEFDKIWTYQRQFYPEILTDQRKHHIQKEIIYYQRPLKSCKHLISVCEFEGKYYKTKEGREVFSGPKVAPRTSPVFQLCKIWESINNISLRNRNGEDFRIQEEQRMSIFNHLDNNEKLTMTDLFRILGIKKEDGYYGGQLIGKGIQGNLTKCSLRKALNDYPDSEDLLKFNVKHVLNPETGELDISLAGSYQNEPLYRLWHIVYSLKEKTEIASALRKQYGIESEEVTDALFKTDFVKPGYGNKSAKACMKILPFLEQGFKYSEACEKAGYNHSGSLTKEQNLGRELKKRLVLLRKNTLRQPVVEKILNQMIHLVNAVMDQWGRPDEIRVELARELKQSREERNNTYRNINQRERENANITQKLAEYGLPPTRRRIEKWRLFHEISGDESRLNATCLYCGKLFGIKEAMFGEEVEVEHILPRSLFYDDSLGNKTLTHRKCNADKGNLTAYDFMHRTRSEAEFNQYLERIRDLYERKVISRIKRDRLLTPGDKIPEGFISRQLRETQYIARKSREILSEICHNVHATSGSVTETVRRLWGWNDILEQLQMERYRDCNMTEWIETERDGQKHKSERIINWSKRDDHRHHAIDALAIACTKQSFIQRLNTLSRQETRDALYKETEDHSVHTSERLNLFEVWLQQRPHFSTAQVIPSIEKVLISFKSGKKTATRGKRKIKQGRKTKVAQENILVPRGALSEETVYGRINTLETKVPVKKLFDKPDLIVKPYIRDLITSRLAECGHDVAKAVKSLKNKPFYLDDNQQVLLEHASVYKEEFVVKYPVSSLKLKDLKYIIDPCIREIIEQRIKRLGEKDAFKDLGNDPLYFNDDRKIPIRSVRCLAMLDPSKVAPLSYDSEGNAAGYVKPGNNHHIAIYMDREGKKFEHVVTFWHAVERKKHGLPAVISNPSQVWDGLSDRNLPDDFLEKLPPPHLKLWLSMQQNEMFVLGQGRAKIFELIAGNDLQEISRHLYRVQKLAKSDYVFRHHLETQLFDDNLSLESKRLCRIRSIKAIEDVDPVKVRVNILGNISLVNETDPGIQ